MPELPDVTVYVECLERRLVGVTLEGIRLASPFVLRTVEPRPDDLVGRRVVAVSRLGKRIVLELEDALFAVLHLMIAGRLRWCERGARIPKRLGQAAFDSAAGTLLLTEAGSKRRASLHLVRGRDGLAGHDRGGLEPLEATPAEFAAALRRERHTLKRSLTDPRILAGIGNAYSDEILHRARLSPFKLSDTLDGDAVEHLRLAAVAVLTQWTARLRDEVGDGFPVKVTAFRDGMAVHGRFGQPCPSCGAPVQRIRFADSECNYCAGCQTGGRLLADRSLSRLLKADWPRTLDQLEQPPSG